MTNYTSILQQVCQQAMFEPKDDKTMAYITDLFQQAAPGPYTLTWGDRDSTDTDIHITFLTDGPEVTAWLLKYS